ncbi:MAG TPA: VOC family protein [Candidatus Dormibacteraeota bacterium]|nr:VOC family protein [Candidatus Dormibacteraeota bacterium]
MITGLGHTAIRVTDLDAALDFYCRILGLREAFRLDREGQPTPWIVYLWVAPGQFLELFPRATGEAGPRGRVGYDHCCLVVDDLPATLRELAARGLAIEGEPVRGLDHNLQFWLRDPDGNPVELMEIVAESPQAAADRPA